MFLLLVVLSFSIFFLLNLFKDKNIKKTGQLPPGPKGLPIIGNLHQFDPAHPHLCLYDFAKTYGPLMSMKFGFRAAIVVSSARVAKLALKNNDMALSGRPRLIALNKLTYNGSDISASSYNATWREMRKIGILHLFSAKQVVSFRPVREDEVSCMIEDMIEKSKSNKLINISRSMFLLTNSFICRAGFGKKYDDQEKRGFNDLFKENQAMLAEFFVGDYFPSLGWIDKLRGMNSRLEKVFRDLDKFCQELIEDHLDPKRPKSMDGDILDLLIGLKQGGATSVHLEWENIKGILIDIFIAGTETSATLIVWAMTSLMKTPRAMKKAQEEVRNLVDNKGAVDEDDVPNLPYLKAIIKETLRLFPPAPLSIPRETIERCTIDGYEIRPKTVVYVNVHAIGLDPEYWENPTEFNPDRFLDSTIDYRGQDFGLLPFGSGRRGCPGINMGIAIVELALANLLYTFDWELPIGMKKEDIDMETSPGITVAKKNDLCLVGKCHTYKYQNHVNHEWLKFL
ncbi:strychnine-11-hydroxylase-like isoform X1 [Primulina eburnea]|uniref:strychnine-11-hydroxylase-like isoform X1 n=1 Tax=Primulina eburnea TaxID=1245227 RepID=UPI003C6C98AD